MLFLMAERGSLSGGALHTVGYYKECAYRFIKVEEKGLSATSFITELGA